MYSHILIFCFAIIDLSLILFFSSNFLIAINVKPPGFVGPFLDPIKTRRKAIGTFSLQTKKRSSKVFSSFLGDKEIKTHTINGKSIENKIEPMGNYVFIQRKAKEEKTSGGVLIPIESREKRMIGKVISVGPGAIDLFSRKTYPMDVVQGDLVLFNPNNEDSIHYDDEDCILVPISEIWAKIQQDKNNFEDTPHVDMIRPINDVVLIKIDQKKEEKTDSGLVLSTQSSVEDTKQPRWGQVIALGQGEMDKSGQRISMEIKPNDHIYISDYALEGRILKFGGERFAFLRYRDIIAKW